jgi:tetratricopeptide (TPR) repeat protein
MTNNDLKRRYGLSAATVRFLETSGLLRRSDDHDFRDLLLLRTLGALRAAKLPTRTIHRTLRHLKPWLSEQNCLSRVHLRASDRRIMVHEGRSRWEPISGQYALPLERNLGESRILAIAKRSKTPRLIHTAHAHYLRGTALDDADGVAASKAYRACLEGDCTHLNARINLGRLLHLQGQHREAEAVYRETKEPNAILFFNLGVLLEDQQRPAEAMKAYQDALTDDPALADAYFNLALLCERAGETQAAFRHLLAYRRLSLIYTRRRR